MCLGEGLELGRKRRGGVRVRRGGAEVEVGAERGRGVEHHQGPGGRPLVWEPGLGSSGHLVICMKGACWVIIQFPVVEHPHHRNHHHILCSLSSSLAASHSREACFRGDLFGSGLWPIDKGKFTLLLPIMHLAC